MHREFDEMTSTSMISEIVRDAACHPGRIQERLSKAAARLVTLYAPTEIPRELQHQLDEFIDRVTSLDPRQLAIWPHTGRSRIFATCMSMSDEDAVGCMQLLLDLERSLEDLYATDQPQYMC